MKKLLKKIKEYRKELQTIYKTKKSIMNIKNAEEKIEKLLAEIEKLKGIIDYERLTKQKAIDRNVKMAVKINELEEEIEKKIEE